jgi:hypothetical protein
MVEIGIDYQWYNKRWRNNNQISIADQALEASRIKSDSPLFFGKKRGLATTYRTKHGNEITRRADR